MAVGNGDGARGQQKQAEKNLGCLPRSAKFIVYSLTLQLVEAHQRVASSHGTCHITRPTGPDCERPQAWRDLSS